MKIFSAQKKDKQNNRLMAKSTGKFFPSKKRVSQMGTISDFISFNNNHQNYTSNLQSPQPLEKLHNFKKNYNKVQSNMQKDPRNLLKCKTAIKIRKINNFLKQKQQKNNTLSAQNQDKRKISVNTPITLKRNISGSLLQIKKNKIYPRYKIIELYSLYKSILQYCERDPKKFLQAFEASLNYRRIIIKSEIVRKNLFDQKHFQFSDFLQMYKKMQDLMFIQSMIDYLQIIFQVCDGNRIKYQTVYEILLKRSEQKIAIFITNIIFKKLNISHQSTVSLQQIIELCQKDMEFCSAFSKLYHHFQHL